MDITAVSANAVLIRLGERIDEALLSRITGLQRRIERDLGDLIIEQVPSYTTLLCQFDPLRISAEYLIQRLTALRDDDGADALATGRTVELPVWYDPQVGPDLLALSARLGLSLAELAARHSAVTYRVYAVGFSPGFAFLGQVDTQLASPRHGTPRALVPAGSVGIADRQTAVYPRASPGGWQIIGNCPLPLFRPDATAAEASLLRVGDRVRFVAVGRADFERLGGRV